MFDGYVTTETIHTSKQVLVRRGTRRSDDQPVVIKTVPEGAPPIASARLRREASILARFDGAQVVRLHEVINGPYGPALVLEDFGALSLADALDRRHATLSERVCLAAKIADALALVHQQGVIHNDLTPSNVLVARDLQRVALADFGIASNLSEEGLAPASNVIEGTLTHISPERTGRMNRPVDTRSDLYSFGVTLYWLVTGALPFDADDPLTLLHAHIACNPRDPAILRPDLPPALVAVVLKLLAKMADERYQSAEALREDLALIDDALASRGPLESFEPGRGERSARFRIPQHLYNRERQLETLHANVDATCRDGQSSLTLLAGPSGIGKTALVNELLRAVARQRGYSSAGKVDHLDHDIPYASLLRALRGLLRQFLSEPPQAVKAWRRRICEALGVNVGVLHDVLPELEFLVGKAPPPPELPSADAANRFRATLRRFFEALAAEQTALVIFLDDLQWSDSATLQLLSDLLCTSTCGITWIGAYRDGEVDDHHPLLQTVATLRRRDVLVTELALAPLSQHHVERLVADTLTPCADVHLIAELVHERSGGIPLLTRIYLQALYDRGALRYDRAAACWELVPEAGQDLADVVTMITNRLAELPPSTTTLLKLAACAGAEFGANLLANATSTSLGTLAHVLRPALEARLLLPIGPAHKYLLEADEVDDLGDLDARYRFVHDRIQQSIYASIPDAHRVSFHHDLALALYRTAKGAPDEQLFALAHHFNASLALVPEDMRLKVAALNLDAGRKAKRATAYSEALSFFRHGVTLLDGDAWQSHHELAFAIHREKMEAEYLAGDITGALARFDPLLARARDDIERCELFTLKVTLETSRKRNREAVEAALRGSMALGERIPRNGSMPAVLRELAAVRLRLHGRPAAALVDLPDLNDERTRSLLRLLSASIPPAYFYDPRLMVVLLLRLVRLTLRHGLSDVAAFGFAGYGMVLSGVFFAHAEAGEFADLALELDRRFQNTWLKGKLPFMTSLFIRSFLRPYAEVRDRLREASRLALDGGDLNYASYAGTVAPLQALLGGDPLVDVREESLAALTLAKRLGESDAAATARSYIFVCEALGTSGARELKADDDIVAPLDAKTTPIAIYDHHLFKALALVIYGDLHGAAASLAIARRGIDAAFTQNKLVELHFLEGLVAARGPAPKRRRTLARALRRLERWSRCCPENFEARYLLVLGEKTRLSDPPRAVQLLLRALASAERNSATYVEALIHESLADEFLAAGDWRAGLVHLEAAAETYARWGALGKVEALDARVVELAPSATARRQEFTDNTASTPTTDGHSTQEIDLSALVNATLSIAKQLDRRELLATVLSALLAGAGARRACLILPTEDGLAVAGRADQEAFHDLEMTPLDDADDLPQGIVNFCYHTRQPLRIDNAADDARFDDPCIHALPIRSVLCLPLCRDNRVVGVIYLDNNLLDEVFDERRERLVGALAAQAAVALENSSLYESLHQTLRRQLDLTEALDRFVPHGFIESLGRGDITQVSRGDSTNKELSILFADIRGYSKIAESLSPTAALSLLNEVYSALEPCVHAHGGFVDSYIGDAMMALFDCPADQAVGAAIDMLSKLREFNSRREDDDDRHLSVCIGINTGEVTLGTIGGLRRLKCSVVGDSVNLASRIERLTRRYDVDLLVSGATIAKLSEPLPRHRFVDRVRVVGRTAPTILYEIYEADEPTRAAAKDAVAEDYARAVEAFYDRRFAEAVTELQRCRERVDDTVIDRLLARAQALVASPPDATWDGVETLVSK